eukprot:3266495-Alexandrium_andersonii.AAC.1
MLKRVTASREHNAGGSTPLTLRCHNGNQRQDKMMALQTLAYTGRKLHHALLGCAGAHAPENKSSHEEGCA